MTFRPHSLDLNCDLGEGESPARTRALMRLIDSANVACGGHAGDLASMTRCIALAHQFGVRLGAHPGAPDRATFGRMEIHPSPEDLSLWVIQQASALARLAGKSGLSLHHIKLHGALYHASETDEALARAYVQTVRHYFPNVTLYSRSGGRVARLARRAGIAVWEELFADRTYRADGNLTPRTEKNAVLTQAIDVTKRLQHWLDSGRLTSTEGRDIPLTGQTLCVHGDTVNAITIAKSIRRLLNDRKKY
jgi:5-oxoprolinase (ATP-hydrolysing) subunit A